MVTLALFGLLAVLVAGVLFLAAAYLLPAGEQIAPPIRDEPLWELPSERALRSDDIAGVRLPVALRGYRFAETDLLLDRLGDELRARDEEIARLKGHEAPVAPDESAEGEQLWGRGSADGLGADEPIGSTEPTGSAEPPVAAEPAPVLETSGEAEPISAGTPEPAVEAETDTPSLTKREPGVDGA